MEDILGLPISGLTEEDLHGFSTQEEWAARLGVTDRTLRNWQSEIIDRGDRTLSAYYWKGRKTDKGEPKNGLDFYQKTLLYFISRLAKGGRTYEEIQQWFLDTTLFCGEPKKRIYIVSRNRIKQALGLQ